MVSKLRDRIKSHYLFHLPEEACRDEKVNFGGEESRHMIASLRVRVGDRLTATNGRGKIYEVRVTQIKDANVWGRIESVRETESEKPEISLYLGLLKQRAMELAVEKCAELGLAMVVPVVSDRSVAALSKNRLERLRRIAIGAMKQSLGSYLTTVLQPISFADALRKSKDQELSIVAHRSTGESQLRNLSKLIKTAGTIAVWIGPEGGFTDGEVDMLRKTGGLVFDLGERRLRSETAAIACIAILKFLAIAC